MTIDSAALAVPVALAATGSSRAGAAPPTPARIAASSTRCTATPTRTWSPTCRPIRRSGRTRRRSSSPTRRSRIPPSTRTSSSRSRRYLAKCLDKKVVFYQVQIERRRDRGDALGPPARRRLLDRADRVRGQPRRRDSVRGQGHREGVPGLQPHRHRQGEFAVPEALRSQGQEGRAHVAVVELGPPGAAGAVPGAGPRSGQGLQDHLLRQARPVGDGRQFRRLRRGAPSPPTCSTGWRERGQVKEADFRIIYRSQKFPTSSFAYAHDLEPEARRQDAVAASTTTASRRKCRRPSTAPTASSRSTTRRRGKSVRAVAKGSGGGFDKATYEKETAREADEAAAKAKKG